MVDLAQPSSALAEFVETLALIDHHVHGAFGADGTRSRFENALNEGSTDPLPDFVSGFDSQLGFAVRRFCAPLLDLEPHAPADEYWARRVELGEREVNRRFLGSAGVSDWVIDTGYAGPDSYGLAEMTAMTGSPCHEIVRLETIAEGIITDGSADYALRLRSELAVAVARGAVGSKTVLAYRSGFDIDQSRPSEADVSSAASALSCIRRAGLCFHESSLREMSMGRSTGCMIGVSAGGKGNGTSHSLLRVLPAGKRSMRTCRWGSITAGGWRTEAR